MNLFKILMIVAGLSVVVSCGPPSGGFEDYDTLIVSHLERVANRYERLYEYERREKKLTRREFWELYFDNQIMQNKILHDENTEIQIIKRLERQIIYSEMQISDESLPEAERDKFQKIKDNLVAIQKLLEEKKKPPASDEAEDVPAKDGVPSSPAKGATILELAPNGLTNDDEGETNPAPAPGDEDAAPAVPPDDVEESGSQN